jgi:hypothetical protein
MCGPATALAVGTGVSQGMTAVGGYLEGQSRTTETNRARLNQYRDAAMMSEFKFQGDEAIRRAAINDFQSGVREGDIALGAVRTGLDKQIAEREGKARVASLAREQKLLQTQGRIAASMPAGRGRERAMTIAAGTAGADESLDLGNLLRARFGAADVYRGRADEAISYRRQLRSKIPLPTRRAPMPSAPVMQSGPSALSLIGGLGQAGFAGFGAGRSLAKELYNI